MKRGGQVWGIVALVIIALGSTGAMWGLGDRTAAPSLEQPSAAVADIALVEAPAAGQAPASAAEDEPQPTTEPAATAVPIATETPNSPPEPSPPPMALETPLAAVSRGSRPQQRVGLQAGHWRSAEHADELAALRSSTGAEGQGWAERDINLDIARRAAQLLEAAGFKVDLLPASVPVSYQADVFLSLHCDANASKSLRGFKVARGSRSLIPEVDDTLVASVYRQYGQITGLPRDDKNITNNMRYYYAFAGGGIRHAVARTTPAAILEMGFLTNASDRELLMGSPDLIARAVAASVADFLGSSSDFSNAPTPAGDDVANPAQAPALPASTR